MRTSSTIFSAHSVVLSAVVVVLLMLGTHFLEVLMITLKYIEVRAIVERLLNGKAIA